MGQIKSFRLFEQEEEKVEKFKVRGYVRPASAFRSIREMEEAANRMLQYQEDGYSVRGGGLHGDGEQSEEFTKFVQQNWGHLLDEAELFTNLTDKQVYDFIEDFVNHRFWSMEQDYGQYFDNMSELRFAYLYSRGSIEPYVMLDDAFTKQAHGCRDKILTVKHYTMQAGLENLERAIAEEDEFDISTFTRMRGKYFRAESNLLVTLKGRVRAAFRSDVKSVALDNGRRAANLLRFEYPGPETNLCDSPDDCVDLTLKTALWNEIIVTPTEIVSVK